MVTARGGSHQRACGLPSQPGSMGTPCAHRPYLRLDRSEVQIGPLDKPWGRRHPLARWQYPLPDEPLDHCLTALSLACRLRERQPVFALREIRQAILIPDTGDTVCPPGLPRPCAIAQALEGGRQGQIATDLRKLADDCNEIGRGRP